MTVRYPVPVIGPILPCPYAAEYRIEAYGLVKNEPIDFDVYTCEEHTEGHTDRVRFATNIDPWTVVIDDRDIACGYVFDFSAHPKGWPSVSPIRPMQHQLWLRGLFPDHRPGRCSVPCGHPECGS